MSTINANFRDMAAQANYPFTADSPLLSGDLKIPADLFLDMSIYPIEANEGPYRLLQIDGMAEGNTVELVFCDSTLFEIGRSALDPTSEKSYIYDAYGNLIGTILFNTELLLWFIDRTAGKRYVFETDAAVLVPSVCCKVPVAGLLAASCNAGVVHRDISISAANGVHFRNLTNGQVAVDLFGELRTLDVPVKTINGIYAKHFWLAAHPGPALDLEMSSESSKSSDSNSSSSSSDTALVPDSAIRVAVKRTERVIKIGKARDFSYGE